MAPSPCAKRQPAPHVYAGCLLNGAATVAHIRQHHADESVLVVCSGSAGGMNLEDFYGAGYIVDQLLTGLDPDRDLTDAAQSALGFIAAMTRTIASSAPASAASWSVPALSDEVRYAAQRGVLDLVTKLKDGAVRVV